MCSSRSVVIPPTSVKRVSVVLPGGCGSLRLKQSRLACPFLVRTAV
jgi:hypothetical protein